MGSEPFGFRYVDNFERITMTYQDEKKQHAMQGAIITTITNKNQKGTLFKMSKKSINN